MRTTGTEIAAAVALVLGIACGVAAGFTGGCSDGCEPEAQRCRGDRVELCDGDQNWYTADRCGEYEPADLAWTCCAVPGSDLLACIPAAECAADGGTP